MDHLAPGTVIHRRIEVSNTTSAVVSVELYSAAATIANGSFLGADGHTPNDLSTWTSVDPDAVDVPAGGLATATVTVAVPADAPPGEQYGAVWAEAGSPPLAAGGITQVSRVGIRLYLSVGTQATITFPDTGKAPPVPTTTTPPGWLYPAIGGLILLVCLAALLAVLTHRRRNSRSLISR